MAENVQKNTMTLREKELRVYFYDTLKRAPTRGERYFIRELIQDQMQKEDLIV